MPEILNRKERERRANQGVFLWGVGNASNATAAQILRIFMGIRF